jgi:hypothetical protein
MFRRYVLNPWCALFEQLTMLAIAADKRIGGERCERFVIGVAELVTPSDY